jgi:serine/threonine protein kinase
MEIKGIKVARKEISMPRRCAFAPTELNLLKRTNHRHVVRLVGSYIQDQLAGLFLHPVAICSLRAFFDDDEDLSPSENINLKDLRLLAPENALPQSQRQTVRLFLFSLFGCLANGLVYLHANKVRHEDIKPSNILLADGEPYLADFGHSKDLSDASHSNTSGGPQGTPKYWAPEVEDGSKRGLAAADIFPLGQYMLK